MVYSRISDAYKNENQEILACIRDPFYRYSNPCIPDGSAPLSGGLAYNISFEITIPTFVVEDIDILVMPSWQCPISYRRAGTPWVTHTATHENIVVPCPTIFAQTVNPNAFNIYPPQVYGGIQENIQIRTYSLTSSEPGPRFKKWRHVSSGVRIFPIDESATDPQPVVICRFNSVKKDMSNYSLVSGTSGNTYPNGLSQFDPLNIRRNVVIVPDFDPYPATPGGFFRNMKGVYSGSLRETSQMKFQLRPNDMFFDRKSSWNEIPREVYASMYVDNSKWGCPLQPSPLQNDMDILESCYDFRFDGLHFRIVNPPVVRTKSIRIRVEYAGNFEVITQRENVIDSVNADNSGPPMDTTHYLSSFLDIYRNKTKERVPGDLL